MEWSFGFYWPNELTVTPDSVTLLAPGFVHHGMNLFPTMPQMHLMMVNLRSQLDWATGCPDIWLNMMSGVPVGVFLDDIRI